MKKKPIQYACVVMRCNCGTLYGEYEEACPECGSDQADTFGMMGTSLTREQAREHLLMLRGYR